MSIFLKNSSRYSLSLLKLSREINTVSFNPLRQEINQSSNIKEKWDLLSAVCLERKPIITKELTEIEKKVQTLLLELEYENSYKSDHEIRCIADQLRSQRLKDGTLSIDMVDDALQQTGQDFYDSGVVELQKFKPASRITKADKENNIKSTQRKLDKHLVLLLNEKLGKDSLWVLPSSKRKDGETMRQTAERTLLENIDKNIEAKFYSNAPCGFYKYKYPKTLRDETNVVGAKIFFYKAQYLNGNIENEKLNYTWATKEELGKLLTEEYNKSVGLFLMDD